MREVEKGGRKRHRERQEKGEGGEGGEESRGDEDMWEIKHVREGREVQKNKDGRRKGKQE